LTTVKITLRVLLEIVDLGTAHWPLAFVVQEPVPPLLHEPLTVALATGLWLASCMVIVAMAVHVLP